MSVDVLAHPVDRAVTDLVRRSSIEIVPKEARKIASGEVQLRPGTRVHIAYTSGSTDEIVEAARIVRISGHSPVPHIPARRLQSRAELSSFVESMARAASLEEVMLIGGDNTVPVGPFAQTMDVLNTGILEGNGVRAFGVAGHPEGHPVISLYEQRRALIEKCEFADRKGMAIHITTQFLFDMEKLFLWYTNFIRPTADRIAIDIGLPGLAKTTTLLRFAKDCGVGASMAMLTKHAGRAFRLASAAFSPAESLVELAQGNMAAEEPPFRSVHFYPFGSLQRTSDWVRAIQAERFSVNERKKTIDVG